MQPPPPVPLTSPSISATAIVQALFVDGPKTTGGSNAAIKARLERIGYTVAVKDAQRVMLNDKRRKR